MSDLLPRRVCRFLFALGTVLLLPGTLTAGWLDGGAQSPDFAPPASAWAPVPARPAPQAPGYRPSNLDRLNALVTDCNFLARQRLTYQFGSDDPRRGGFDCSGAMQWLLRRSATAAVPRTASDQYLWLSRLGLLTPCGPGADPRLISASLRPGDLLFWRGTYNPGRWPDVSHVMIYVGRHPGKGTLVMFGSSSRKGRGLNGNAVDFFEFDPAKGGRGQFVGFGRVPGISAPPLPFPPRPGTGFRPMPRAIPL